VSGRKIHLIKSFNKTTLNNKSLNKNYNGDGMFLWELYYSEYWEGIFYHDTYHIQKYIDMMNIFTNFSEQSFLKIYQPHCIDYLLNYNSTKENKNITIRLIANLYYNETRYRKKYLSTVL
jgi:hypothetical protein